MTTAVQDNLVVTLDEVKEWLRIDDDLETTLVQASSAGAVTHKLSELSRLRSGKWLSVAGVDAKITYVDPVESNIVVDRVVSPAPLPEGTAVTYFHGNNNLMNAIEAAKYKADEYLGNSFKRVRVVNDVPLIYTFVPPEVKVWVMSYVAFLYASPEVGIESQSMREAGTTRFDSSFETIMEPIRHLRMIPFA